MKDPQQEKLIRRITDEVEALTRKYKGLLWGEHGKGVRSEYAPEFFGPLYPALQRIKRACDPRNQLNPGKICTPAESRTSLMTIDGVPTRGQHDRHDPGRDPGRLRRGDELQRQRRLLQLRSVRRHVPLVERDASTHPFAQGSRLIDARVAAPAGAAGRRSGGRKPPTRRDLLPRQLPAAAAQHARQAARRVRLLP